MKSKFFIPKKYIYVLCIMLMAGLIAFTYAVGGISTIGRKVASYTIIPIEKGIKGVSSFISSKTGNFKEYSDLLAENESLKNKIQELEVEMALKEAKMGDYELMRSLFNMDENYNEYETIGAQIIGKESGGWYHTFIINKGKNSGIEVNMNVISDGALIGIVTEVSDTYSQVKSIINDGISISCMIKETEDKCIVNGSIKMMDEGRIKLNKLENNNSDIKVGYTVVTSSISTKYLPGLIVGYVSEIQVEANNLSRYGYITPAGDFSHLDNVLVIKTLKNPHVEATEEDTALPNTVIDEKTDGEIVK